MKARIRAAEKCIMNHYRPANSREKGCLLTTNSLRQATARKQVSRFIDTCNNDYVKTIMCFEIATSQSCMWRGK